MSDSKTYTLLDAKGATGIGKMAYIGDGDVVNLSVHTTNSADMTVQFPVSDDETPPDVTAASSATNDFEYAQIIDLEDGSALDGDTGFVPTGTDQHRKFEVNMNGGKWIIPHITAWTAGNVTIKATVTNHYHQ